MDIQASTVINASRETVFAFFADFPESAKVLHNAFRTDFESSNTTGLGAEWIQHDESPERPVVARHKVIAFDAPATYTMTSDDKRSFETMVFRFDGDAIRTRVTFDLTIKPKGLFLTIFLFALKSMIRGAMREDLERMKNAIESQ